MTPNTPIAEFFARSFTPETYPRIRYVPGQASLCIFGPIDGHGMIHWRPVRRAPHLCRSILERYQEMRGAIDARELVSGYWSSTLDCNIGYESITLECGAWNEEEYFRKQDLLRERFEFQDKHDQPLSVPFATTTSGAELRYALRLADGEVWLEEHDGAALEKKFDSLREFFQSLRYQAVTEDFLHRVFE